MAFVAGAITSKLTLDRTKFSASIKAVRKQSKSLGGWVKKNSGQFKAMGLAATAAGAAVLLTFKKMVKQYVETGDMIHKMAIRTGFAAETLSELAFAAEISGADITMLEKGVKKMAKTISDADRGMATYIDAFKAIGFEVKDLIDLSPEDQFMKIGLAIADVENPTLRAAAAVDIFGRAGTMLLPLFAEGSEGMKILAEDAHRLGIIFDAEMAAKAAKLKDAQTALTGSVKGLSIAILNDLIPVLTTATKSLTDFFVESRVDANNWAEAILKFFELVTKGTMKVLAGFQILQSAIFEMATGVVQVLRTQIENLIIGFGLLAKVGVPVKGILGDLITAWGDLRAVEKGYLEQMEKHIDQAADVIAAFTPFFELLKNIKTGLKDAAEGTKDVGKAATKSLGPFTSWAASIAILFQAVLDNITRTSRDMSGVLEQAVTEMTSDVFKYKRSWQDTMREVLAGASSVVGGLDSIFSQFHENESTRIENEEKQKTDAIEAWYERNRERIERTITDETEKVAALEALDEEKARKENKLQVQMDKERRKLERKRAKAQKASALISAGINVAEAITKALTAGPLIGQIFAGIVAALGAVQMAAIAAAPLPALARGGRIGAAGIVGEEGPELFFPRTPGTIVPLRSEATPLGSQPSISIRIMGSLISTTGVARADLERAGNTLFDIIEMQARRRGYTLNGT